MPIMSRKSIIACLVVFAGLLSGALAQWTGEDVARESLRGLKSIRVAVDPIGHFGEKAGLDPIRIRAEVEHYFEQAGIPVLKGDSAFDRPLDSYFRVQVTLVKGRFRTWSYAVTALVQQPAVLQSNNEALFVPTWQRGEVGNITTGKLGELRDTVGEYARMFVSDYRAANSGFGSRSVAP